LFQKISIPTPRRVIGNYKEQGTGEGGLKAKILMVSMNQNCGLMLHSRRSEGDE